MLVSVVEIVGKEATVLNKTGISVVSSLNADARTVKNIKNKQDRQPLTAFTWDLVFLLSRIHIFDQVNGMVMHTKKSGYLYSYYIYTYYICIVNISTLLFDYCILFA